MANSAQQSRCVFVGNIPYDATEEQLVQICEEVGPVVSFRLVLDRETGKPRGYGFCEYKDVETANSARRNLQGYEINGRQLRVDFAENDKGSDRNREQGRGGPGLAPNVGGPMVADLADNQPMGIPSAVTAASVMAAALGDVQTSGMGANQNGFQGQPRTDPLTLYLASRSKSQLYEILSEMKAIAQQNQALAKQMMTTGPQFSKAVFQAQIMLNMASPQMLQQMANTRQSSNSLLQPPLHEVKQEQQSMHPATHQNQVPPAQTKVQAGLLPRIPEGQPHLTMPQNSFIAQPSSVPLQHVPMPPRFPLLPQTHGQVSFPPHSGLSTVLPMRAHSLSGVPVKSQAPPVVSSKPLQQQIQPPLPQLPRPIGHVQLSMQNPALQQQSSLPNSFLSQQAVVQVGSSQSSGSIGGLEAFSREAGMSNPSFNNLSHDAAQVTRSTAYSNLALREQAGITGDSFETPLKKPKVEASLKQPKLETPLKQPKLEDGSVTSSAITGVGSLSGVDASHNSEQQAPQLQFRPEDEPDLIKQLMNLKPEQLNTLSPELQMQVIQLQQMLQS
ncbi:cleavage stimulating factor 64 isoform X1 [Amborella trichopoda]|uniref:cleavage stimulating factor 64 isoform X1 n=2 Tax=Amborella trichopoda TaxID=13333 RepID=UPI0005D3A23F|nr:cleavage stimulating factor 64 isoform X1 [Amborella trichopoda]|eukprot:XP_011628966.1 cleavage stimulating factor 64 isoform X1 [Amborella trichopoda]